MTRNMTDTVSLLWEGEEKETKLRDVKRNWNNDGEGLREDFSGHLKNK